MASNYKKIRDDKTKEYGTKVGKYGRIIADLYSDRSHFILEILQNAEDALKDRGPSWRGSRAISFRLTKNELRASHFGRPFNEADVRGICEIGESIKAKDLTAIGRFGIGFKSVNAVTERPEIHSGPEDFAIEDFVLPLTSPYLKRDPEETIVILPLNPGVESAQDDIAERLEGLGTSSLLFLHQIEEVQWRLSSGRNGHYLRESKSKDKDIRQVTVIGEMPGQKDIGTDWLVFSRQVSDDKGRHAGYVEIAFYVDPDKLSIRRTLNSPLVVFFPTVLETHLGFLMQGPYRTTPSRDNIPLDDSWNQHLIRETAILLPQVLRWLRDQNLLTTEVLRCLPLSRRLFGASADPSHFLLSRSGMVPTRQTRMLAPLFDATQQALAKEPLLPRLNGGYISAENALLGRTEGIRELFSIDQLSALYESSRKLAWLSSDITQDRTPEIRNYVMNELGVEEVDPESILRKLSDRFLEAQSDSWVLKLYEFLCDQRALVRMLTGQNRHERLTTPLIRLSDGRHVRLGQLEAFLPSEGDTDFPTISPAVCRTPGALSFLRALGLREPDLVDDVVRNILPKYQEKRRKVSDAEYESDMARILRAFDTDSNTQREKLVSELRRSMFVKSMSPGTSEKYRSKPDRVYLATDQVKELFEGVDDVRIVDDSYTCLRGEKIQELLKKSGATSCLKPVIFEPDISWEVRRRMRRGEGSTRSERVVDWTLMGLDGLLKQLQPLSQELRRQKASLLWEALIELVRQQGTRPFWGTYEWHYYNWRRHRFTASFIEQLNETPWVPDEDGNLQRPCSVLFDNLGWQVDRDLLSHICFKQPTPPVDETLARAAGVDPECIEILRTNGVTPEVLRGLLRLKDGPVERDVTPVRSESEAHRDGAMRFNNTKSENAGLLESTNEGDSASPPENSTPTKPDEPVEPFAKVFFGVGADTPYIDSDQPTTFPEGGPLTEASAKRHTRQSVQFGRSGAHRRKAVKLWEPTEAAAMLAEEFKAMVHGDYGRRCQICGTTFRMWNGGLQTFVVHVVDPKNDFRTNHLGDLMGLCGQHFALVRYGEWTWLNPKTGKKFEASEGRGAWENWRNFVLNAKGTDAEETDEDGNNYIGLPIRFWNIYKEWNARPDLVNAIVRYNVPHWKYLCELIKT